MATLDDRTTAYMKQSAIVGRAHYDVAESLGRAHTVIGGAIAVLSAILATSLFASMEVTQPEVRWLEAILSALVAVLASLLAFLDLSRRSGQHKQAGSNYGEIRRRIEIFQMVHEAGTRTQEEDLHEFAEIAEQLYKLAADSPYLAKRAYNRAARSV